MDDPRIQALSDQMNTILLVLERPTVQRQLLAFLVVFALAWSIPRLFQRTVTYLFQGVRRTKSRRPLTPGADAAGDAKTPPSRDGKRRVSRRERALQWLQAVHVTLFPILGLLLGQLAIQLFAAEGWRSGLLENFAPLFWLLLAYRVLVALLYGFLPSARAEVYQFRILLPVALIVVLLVINRGLAGTFPLGAIEIITLLGRSLTLGLLFAAVTLLYVFFALAWGVRELLSRVILPRTHADSGVTNTVVITSYYTIIAIGILVAVSTLGFDLSTLAIIGGGLSVGLGFGMQELVGNFVSGILLLFERTLRPGDIIEVDGARGVVGEMRMRATLIRTIDNVEIIIPNKNLLTSTVSTYTQTDRTIRRIIRVGVSYASDPTQVRDILLSIADRHGQVLKKPAAEVYFVDFGASSLDFEMAFWLDDPMYALKVTSDLHFMIWREFEKFHIEIPFPQQDLHVRSGVPWERLSAPRASTESATNKRGAHGEQRPQPGQEASLGKTNGSADDNAAQTIDGVTASGVLPLPAGKDERAKHSP